MDMKETAKSRQKEIVATQPPLSATASRQTHTAQQHLSSLTASAPLAQKEKSSSSEPMPKATSSPAEVAANINELLRLSDQINIIISEDKKACQLSEAQYDTLRQTRDLIRKARSTTPTGSNADLLREICKTLELKIKQFDIFGTAVQQLPDMNQAIPAYRADILEDGTYAGMAEAEVIASTVFHRSVPVYTRNADGSLSRVLTVGQGPTNGNWGILHLGNHFVAVNVHPDGTGNIVNYDRVETNPDGNCLYHAMCCVYSKGRPIKDLATIIGKLRHAVSQNISDDMIRESILGIVSYNDMAGLGPQMSALFSHGEESDTEVTSKIPPLQELLTATYWRKQLTSLPTPDFWQKYGSKKASERKVEDILNKVGPELLTQLQKYQEEGAKRLQLYRGMSLEEALRVYETFHSPEYQALLEKIRRKEPINPAKSKDFPRDKAVIPDMGHLGSQRTAEKYAAGEKNVMVELTLKPGAHNLLFNPNYTALAPKGSGVTAYIAAAHKDKFPIASRDQGELAGYIGINTEDSVKTDGMSIAIGNKIASRLLLQLMTESIHIVDKTAPSAPAESAAKKDAESTSKKGAESTAKKGAESTAKKGAESTAKKGAESTAKKGAESTAKKGAESTAKKGAESTAKKGTRSNRKK